MRRTAVPALFVMLLATPVTACGTAADNASMTVRRVETTTTAAGGRDTGTTGGAEAAIDEPSRVPAPTTLPAGGPTEPANPAVLDEVTWETTNVGAWKVLLPSTATTMNTQIPGSQASEVFTAFVGDTQVVAIGATMTTNMSERDLQQAAQGMALGSGGELESSTATTINGNPAMDATLRTEIGTGFSRIVANGRELLFVLATGTDEARATTELVFGRAAESITSN